MKGITRKALLITIGLALWCILGSALALAQNPVIEEDQAPVVTELVLEEAFQDAIILSLGHSRAISKGRPTFIDLQNDQIQPIVKEGRTLVPVRFISENVGAYVEYNDSFKRVSIYHQGTSIHLILGEQKMTVNGVDITLDVAAEAINGRTLLPLRAVTEALRREVFYERGLIVVSDVYNIIPPASARSEEQKLMFEQLLSWFEQPLPIRIKEPDPDPVLQVNAVVQNQIISLIYDQVEAMEAKNIDVYMDTLLIETQQEYEEIRTFTQEYFAADVSVRYTIEGIDFDYLPPTSEYVPVLVTLKHEKIGGSDFFVDYRLVSVYYVYPVNGGWKLSYDQDIIDYQELN
jgi:hypothetical protein